MTQDPIILDISSVTHRLWRGWGHLLESCVAGDVSSLRCILSPFLLFCIRVCAVEYFLHSPASRNPRYQQNQRHCVQADELCPKSSFPGIRQEWMIETPRPRVADNVWNTSAYKAYGMKRPWYYFGERCVRTLVHGFGELVGRDFAREVRANFEGTPHDALDDGKHQIRYLMPARNAVGGLGRMSDVFLPSPTQSSTDSGEDKPVISKSTFWTSEPAKSPVRKSVSCQKVCRCMGSVLVE